MEDSYYVYIAIAVVVLLVIVIVSSSMFSGSSKQEQAQVQTQSHQQIKPVVDIQTLQSLPGVDMNAMGKMSQMSSSNGPMVISEKQQNKTDIIDQK